MHDSDQSNQGLLHAFVLDGQGSAQVLSFAQLAGIQLAEQESLWLHWDRSHQEAEHWLREHSGLNEFVCDLLLEESTRPRLLRLEQQELLVFLRGINLNPLAESEDMVSLRIFASVKALYSLRQRHVGVTEQLLKAFAKGFGPKNISELLLFFAQSLTDRIENNVGQLADTVDLEEANTDNDQRYAPALLPLLQARRSAANLRRFLAPQRDVFASLTHSPEAWFMADDTLYWNELNNRLMLHLEDLELTRERISLVLETEHRRRNERMSHTMYMLAVITGFFLPMSFVTGLMGINVGGIPGAEHPYGFLMFCVLIGIFAVGQWLFFRWLRWV